MLVESTKYDFEFIVFKDDTFIMSIEPTKEGLITFFIVMFTLLIDVDDCIALLTKIWFAYGIDNKQPLFTDERQDKLDIVVKSKY